jgi:acetyl esterase/lipase
MDQLRLGLRLLGSLISTLFARLKRGPVRPSWSFLFEAMVLSLRRTTFSMAKLEPLEQRRAYRAIAQPNPLRKEIRIVPVDAGGVPSRWIIPAGVPDDASVLLYFHGGSYRYGSYESHAELISRLGKSAGARVLVPDYRLAPPDRFPAAADDAATVLRWLGSQRVVVSGDSAGGALAIAAMLGAKECKPRGALLICPWVDLTASGGSLEKNSQWDWAGPEHFIDWAKGCADESQWKDPRLSPLFADLSGLPPMLIQLGEAEMLHDQVIAFAEKAKRDGVDVRLTIESDMIHDWHLLSMISPVAGKSIEEAGAFVRERLTSLA